MKIAICEDRKEEAEWLYHTVQQWALEQKLAIDISSFADAASFSFALEDTLFDALFLDIKMPGEDGVSLAKRLRAQANDMPIVFVTGEKEYVMEGYEVEAVNYLLKPVDEKKVYQCLNRIYEKKQQQEPFILLQTADTTVRLLQREIYMLEVFGHRVVYTTVRGTYELLSTMKEAQQTLLAQWFVTCHRGVLVNLLYVDYIDRSSLTLSDKKQGFHKKVPVSRRLYPAINEAFIRFYKTENEPLTAD